jgi:hypothetical protein
MVGGLGICGRPFCCATFLDDFQPVSIKMAKTQNLSLNPTKISGTCGRLMCCLKYEQDAYEDLLKKSPKVESFVDTVDGRGTVIEVDLLRQRVKVRLENEEGTGVYNNADIAVLRNGKAKKTDPPIPEDLAPISGSGKRRKKSEDAELPMMLDSIRLRYSTETIAEEQMIREEPEKEEAKPGRSGRNRRRRPKAAQQEKSEQPKQEQPKKAQPKKEQPKPEQPKKEQPQQTGEQTQKRRRPPRRRRPRQGGGAPKE